MRNMIADRGMGEPISLGAALEAGKKVAPDVTNLLADDHRVVLGWFAWYEQSDDPDLKARITARICLALRAHMAAEEEILYRRAEQETGDEEIVSRARQEHQGAKGLMDKLEGADVDDTHRDLMRELRAEIEAHVDEEERTMFSSIRDDGVDLYDIGRGVAARRVDRLFELAGAARADDGEQQHRQATKEYPVMSISPEVARRYFIDGLKNAHAAASQGRTMVHRQLQRLEHYPRLKDKLQAHAKEKDAQLERIEAILERCGEKPSAVKDTAMTLAANLGAAGGAAAADEVIKNSFATLGLAKAEAAAYETLILFGQAAGVDEALRPLQQCLSEERGMAAFIEENLRGVGMGFLQLESQGAPGGR